MKMGSIEIATYVFALAAAISFFVAGLIRVTFVAIQAAQRRSLPPAPESEPATVRVEPQL